MGPQYHKFGRTNELAKDFAEILTRYVKNMDIWHIIQYKTRLSKPKRKSLNASIADDLAISSHDVDNRDEVIPRPQEFNSR